MAYFLGIDGGGTKTKLTIINEFDQIIYTNVSGPTSIDTVSNETTIKHINDGLIAFFADHPHAIFNSVFCGLGGIALDEHHLLVEHLLTSIQGVNHQTKLIARNDMENALYSGRCFDEGMTLICGTGMVAYGKDTFGNTHKSGGWGYKEGELGSSYHLGMMALRYVIRAFDGRYDKDEFAIATAKKIHMTKASDIVEIMNAHFTDRTWISQLAPFITTYANQNHFYARSVVDDATDELALAIASVYKKLKLNKKRIVIVGSLGNSGGYFGEQLHKKIKTIDKTIDIISPLIEPSYASAIMARRLST